MERPKIEDFMPEGTTFTDMHLKFRDNPELYRYICALDLYIDELIKERIKQSLADYMKEFTPDNIIVGGEAEPPLTMIYKLTFEDGRIDWCTAKDQLHLLKSYDADFDLPLQEIESLEEIGQEEAKTIMVRNSEYDEDNPDEMPEEISLYELADGDDFCVIASTEFC